MGNVSIVTTIATMIAWVTILAIVYVTYRKMQDKPKFWKVIVVTLIGTFSFIINIDLFGTSVRLPTLPLGVLILMILFIYNSERWKTYRSFAWIGFIGQFVFLFMSLLAIPFNHFIYPADEPSTYIADTSDASVIPTHPSAEEFSFDENVLNEQIHSLKRETIYSDQWYEEVSVSMTPIGEDMDERFPYFLAGVEPKWGSGINSALYIEKDGKGLLVSTPEAQYYFRANQSLVKVGEQ